MQLEPARAMLNELSQSIAPGPTGALAPNFESQLEKYEVNRPVERAVECSACLLPTTTALDVAAMAQTWVARLRRETEAARWLDNSHSVDGHLVRRDMREELG